MSATEFSAALRNRALTAWFKNEKAGGGGASKSKQEQYSLENINVLVNPVSIYRTSEQTSEKTSFVITKDTVRDLISEFHGVKDEATLKELTETYFSAFRAKNVGVAVSRKKITIGKDMPAVYFPNISFDGITKLVNNVLNIKTGELQKSYEKGHVVGLTTTLLEETSARIKAVDTTGSTGKSFLLAQLDNVIAYYKRMDLASANIQPTETIKLYGSFDKRISKDGNARYLVELQPKAANQQSSKEVLATIGSVRKLFTPGALTEKAIIELIDTLKSRVTDPKFQQDLVNMRSSPSFKDMITTHIVGILSNKATQSAYMVKNTLVGSKRQPTANLKQVGVEAKKKIAEATALKARLKQQAPRQFKPRQELSLLGLQRLINSQLQDVVSANMGDGDSRQVLNYRTGRLAGSARAERLSQSREGLITVFYSYMKAPYSTFSQGGLQAYPTSRDPKLLIAKSIREIALQYVGNRLRSVAI